MKGLTLCLLASGCIVLSGQSFANNSHEAMVKRIAATGKVKVDHTKKETKPADKKANKKRKKEKAAEHAGKKVYDKFCMACHASGAAGAPKLNEPKQWEARIKQGQDVLVKHVIKGYKFMPPMGTCMSCSKEDIHAAVDYMVQTVKKEEKK